MGTLLFAKAKSSKTFALGASHGIIFSLDSANRRIWRKFCVIYNRSNGGVALHEVLPLATEIRLKSIDKQGVKLRVNRIPQNKLPKRQTLLEFVSH